jgi:hypothetical protein
MLTIDNVTYLSAGNIPLSDDNDSDSRIDPFEARKGIKRDRRIADKRETLRRNEIRKFKYAQ